MTTPAHAPPRTPDALLAAIDASLLHGATPEVRALCREGLGMLATVAEPAALATRLMRLEARAALLEGDQEAGRDALEAALAVAECHGDAAGAAHALNNMSGLCILRGELDEAARLCHAVREQAERAGERDLAALSALNLGIVANIRGDLAAALGCYRGALDGLRALGRDAAVARTLNNIGLLHADLGRWREAEAAYAEALPIVRRLGDLDVHARLHTNLAEVALGLGDLARARAECREALAVCDRTPHGAPRGDALRMSGVVARECGAHDEAEAHFAGAERLARERGDLLLLAETAREQADLWRRQGRNRDVLVALNRAHRIFTQLRARRDLADVERRVGRLEGDFVEVARRWGESIEAKDRYTQGHCQRVADLACAIAAAAGPAHGFDAQALFWFRIGALLHDVGKLTIPAEVLNKPGKLTDAEWALMRGHAEAGVALLDGVEFPWDVRPIVESHHERWDGRGYPHGLAGEAIPLAARVLAVADVYDALTSVRSYKRAMSHAEAAAILRRDAGSAFDPQVVAWFEMVAPAWARRRAADAANASALGAGDPDPRATRRRFGLDEVTGLPGRQAFLEECARVLVARAADRRPTALLLVTVAPAVEGASAVGAADGAGEAVDDAALHALADALARNTRGGDFVARYAAREFVVLLPDVAGDEAHDVAARLAEAAAGALAGVATAPAAVARIAVAVAPPGEAAPERLLAAADAARRREAPGGATGGPRWTLATAA